MVTLAIKYAILGILSYQPQTGYDLKKMFADSAVLYWSGNNNQIYRTLLELSQAELVTQEVQFQEKHPPKKVYSITDRGRAELKQWLLSAPEPPEYRNYFLVQLTWAAQLDSAELGTLLDKYEHEVRMQLLMQQEKARRGQGLMARTPREAFLWDKINENILGFYERELDWVGRLRAELGR